MCVCVAGARGGIQGDPGGRGGMPTGWPIPTCAIVGTNVPHMNAPMGTKKGTKSFTKKGSNYNIVQLEGGIPGCQGEGGLRPEGMVCVCAGGFGD